MTDTPTEDQPGFVAENPEHCFACYRLIRPGQAYYLTISSTQSSNGCAFSARTAFPQIKGAVHQLPLPDEAGHHTRKKEHYR